MGKRLKQPKMDMERLAEFSGPIWTEVIRLPFRAAPTPVDEVAAGAPFTRMFDDEWYGMPEAFRRQQWNAWMHGHPSVEGKH